MEANFSHPIKYSTDEVSFNMKKYSLMGNVYFDYLTCTPWTPYVGAGIGYAWLKPVAHVNGSKFNKSQYNFAWQVMAGVAYDINSNWTVDLGYKYADLGRVRKNDGVMVNKLTVRDHEILLGIRYNF
ncbi:porin family protein [bacterium]|nr:porin family protein [bacterium]